MTQQFIRSCVSARCGVIAALEVGGADALKSWGQQWAKLLGLVYEGATVGIQGERGRLIGGKTGEGTAARVRVQLEVERLLTQA